ncbi:MAG: glycosyltransferase [Bacteroidetes bacterium]|nr:glycosyltransferase [Bacteroidota bacterium]
MVSLVFAINSPIGLLVRLTEETNNTSSPEPEGSIGRWTRSDIDVVAVTTDRFRSVKELLKSSRHILGDDVGVTVVVQQPESWRWRRLAKRFRARLLHVDDDSGLSWSRNHGVTNTTRPLIFLMDDDFQLDDRCRIDAALDILTCDDEISVLGGNLLDVHYWRDPRRDEVSQGFAMRMVSQPPELEWLRVEDAPRERVFHTLTDYVEFCDIVDNFALIRRDRTFDRGVWWNPDLKIGAEHQDFYLRFNEKGIGSIARTNVLKVRNVRVQSARFRALRNRTDTFFRVFFEDWGLRSFRIIGERTRTNTADGGQAYLEGAQESPIYVAREGAS